MESFKPLSHYLRILLEQRGLGEKLQEAQIPELFRTIVGETVWQKIESLSWSNGELIVRTNSPIWRIELRLRAESIRRKLNQQLGTERITAITIL